MTDTNTQKAQGSGAGEALRSYRNVIAYSIIEGSGGIRAAEHAKDFQTANWTDALRSADAVIASLAALSQPPEASEVERVFEPYPGAFDNILGPEECEVEATAWTGSGSLAALEDGREGYIWPQSAEAHPIPLYAHPPKASPMRELQKLGQEFDAGVEASALRSLADSLKERHEYAFEHAEGANHIDAIRALANGLEDIEGYIRSLAQPAPEQGEG